MIIDSENLSYFRKYCIEQCDQKPNLRIQINNIYNNLISKINTEKALDLEIESSINQIKDLISSYTELE